MKPLSLRLAQAARYVTPRQSGHTVCLYGVNAYKQIAAAGTQAGVLCAQLGAQVMRISAPWVSMQFASIDAINYTILDAYLNGCAANNIVPIIVMDTSPPWANGGLSQNGVPTYLGPNWASWISAYTTFAVAVAQHAYAICPTVIMQPMNEPNTNSGNNGFWRENDTNLLPTFAAWNAYHAAIYSGIKAANSSIKVIPAAMKSLRHWFVEGTDGTHGLSWVQQFMAGGGVADGIAIHPYPAYAGQDPFVDYGVNANSFTDIGLVRAAMIAGGNDANGKAYATYPVYVTECGNYNESLVGSPQKAIWTAALYRYVDQFHSIDAVGANAAPVVSLCYFNLVNNFNGTIDTDFVGMCDGNPYAGPNAILSAGLAFQAFQKRVLTSLTLTGPTSVIATHLTTAYTVVGLDQFGVPMAITPIFHSSTGNVTIGSGSGVALGVSAGTSSITATVGAVTSNAITLTVSAQVATSPIVVSPSSFTVAPTATQALTAVVSDQGTPANVISGASVSWSSGTPANITVDAGTGVTTGVTGGTSTITATSGSATGTSAGTCSGGATVTSVHLFYTGALGSLEMTNGMLLFTGNTYQLTAKDQAGNTLSGGSGTWATSDGTNFPVSAGLISPAAGIGGGTVTFTHTASGQVGTVNLSVLKTPGAIYKQGGISGVANTAVLMGQIWTNVGVDSAYNSGLPVPTNAVQGASLYTDGLGANHFSIDTTTTSRQFMGNGVMVQAIPTTTPVSDGALLWGISGFTRAWQLQVFRFDPGFTVAGQGGGGQSFKIGNWFAFSGGGRVGIELDNPGLPNIVNDCIKLNGGSTVGGAQGTLGNITTEFSGGEVWCSLVMYEVRGGNIMSSRVWWFKIGTVPAMLGTVTEGPMTGGASPGFAPPSPVEGQPTGVNYNQAPPFSQLNISFPLFMLVNGDTQGDPFGVLADTSSPTLTGISGGTVARGATAASIVLTGTNFTLNCQPKFSSAFVLPQSITINSSTQMTVVVAVNSGATPGSFTILVNNQSSQTSSSTQPITIT